MQWNGNFSGGMLKKFALRIGEDDQRTKVDPRVTYDVNPGNGYYSEYQIFLSAISLKNSPNISAGTTDYPISSYLTASLLNNYSTNSAINSIVTSY